ncbi:polymorphic toxin-type HINT domain-containing protein [Paenibacillus hodogayensis]|uniref:Polymorphic toxin-type HINT domain-containing protein n=1 Tax=Paenibacillus hodogayensis TaxID=279208 RepID=A0ABV5VYC5_9BACL
MSNSTYQRTMNALSSTSFPRSYDELAVRRLQVQTDVAPFALSAGSENISPINGALNLRVTDLVLPGRNGLSFALTRQFNSADATYYDKYVYQGSITREKYYLDLSARLYTTNPYQLTPYGSASAFSIDPVFGHFSFVQYMGWYDKWPYPFNYYVETQEFDETVRKQLQASYPYVDPNNINSPSLFSKMYLINGTYLEAKAYTTGGVYRVPYYQPEFLGIGYSNKTKAFPNENRFPIGKGWSWDIPYIELKDNKNYLHLPGGSAYQISGNSLVGYPWNDLSITYDSSVTVNDKTSYYVLTSIQGQKQYFTSYGQLIQMADLFGNTVQFEYSYISPYGSVLTKVRDALDNEINITYSTTKVTLTSGDRTVEYDKMLDPQGNKELLSRVTDPKGRQTLYEYSVASTAFDLVASGTREDNFAALLTKVHHPTQARTEYTYTPYERRIGTFAIEQAYRVTAREEVMTPIGVPSMTANRVTYSYNGDGAGVMPGPSDVFMTTVNDGRVQSTYTYDKIRINDDLPYVYYNTGITQHDGVQTTTSAMEYNRTNRWPTPIKRTSKTIRGTEQSVEVITQTSYDPYGNVTSETDPNNVVTSYGYDNATHLLRSVTQPINNSGLTAYTEIDRYPGTNAVQQVRVKEGGAGGPLKSQISYGYDGYGNATAVTLKDDNRDIVVSTAYDGLYSAGFPTSQSIQVTDANNQTTTISQSFAYTKSTGERTRAVDGKGYATDYEFDKLGRLTKVKHPDASEMKLTYDDAANELVVKDETQIETRTQWNPLGWKVAAGIVGKAQQTFGYDAYGRVSWSKDGAGNQTDYTYDNRNRLKTTVYPGGATATVAYDDVNRIVTETDAEGNKTVTASDVLGRMIRKERNSGSNERMGWNEYAYDYAGNLTTLQDGRADGAGGVQTTQYGYDILNRLVAVTDALANTTRYTYSMANNLTRVEYPDHNQVQKQYDQVGRLIRSIDASNQIETYAYDANSNLLTSIDRKGQTRTFGYDSRNRQLSSAMSDEVIAFQYDAAGRRQWMQDNTGRTNYTYDSATGWLTTVQSPDQYKVQYQYNDEGKRIRMIDPFGVATQYKYDTRSRLKEVGPAENDWYARYSYQGNNLPKEQEYRNGVKSTSTYTEYNLNGLTHTNAGGTFRTYSYGYDLHRNQTSRTENGAGHNFGYDALNRIATSSQFNEQYQYDKRGNRASLQSDKPLNLFGASYQYDNRNRLTGVNTGTGAVVGYRYNGDGLLVERSENGVTTRYYYDGADMIAEGTVSGGAVTHKASYIRGNGLVARVDGNGGKAYYVHNGHGDVVALTDGTGNVLNQYTYDMWGNPLTEQESVPNPFRYSGEFWDKSTQLQYLRARWYDPSMGRFINEDTYEGDISNPLSLNLYTYVQNNPLINVDPSGHSMCGIGGEGAAWCYNYFSGIQNKMQSIYYSITDSTVFKGTQAIADFAVLDDVNTLLDSNASLTDKGLAGLGFIPVGKVYKGGKILVSLANKYKTISREVKASEDAFRAVKNIACNCFIAGTKVQTKDGEKPIEDVKVGDQVLAKDDITGEVAYKDVQQLFQREEEETYNITVGNELITTTSEHPFWIVGVGWVKSKYLLVGDILTTSNGKTITIDKIEVKKEHVTVYNFKVEDFHTYFVSNLGIWTHNSCFTWTGKGFDNLAKGLTPDDFIKGLEDSGWTKTIESGGRKSGDATIFLDPSSGTKVRIHASPGEGSPYFRVQNSGGGYLDASGIFPSNATKQELRDLTHFYFGQ